MDKVEHEIGLSTLRAVREIRRRRATRPESMDATSPAAVDEVFAALARAESIRRADDADVPRPIDPKQFRALSAEMDRQRDRLAQLLRDIDGPAASV